MKQRIRHQEEQSDADDEDEEEHTVEIEDLILFVNMDKIPENFKLSKDKELDLLYIETQILFPFFQKKEVSLDQGDIARIG